MLTIILAYVLLCSLLRHRRVRQALSKYGYVNRDHLKHMTAQQAFEIQQTIFQYEFPFTTEKALQFALFRTYGIPTISSLLTKTAQLSDKSNAPKRYVDTTVLIQEFVGHAPDSERAIAAISRMNYIHSMYQRAGKISNDDMLYTLALFGLEPVRWINTYEWRQLTDLETCAFGTFWKDVGDAMEIDYGVLPGSKGGRGWKDGLEWLEEVDVWRKGYEERCMVPDEANRRTADETTAILLWDVPESLRGAAKWFICALMDERLRRAMMYPDPPRAVSVSVNAVLQLRKLVLRFLALPRPHFMRIQNMSEEPDKNGRIHVKVWDSEPWYVEPTFVERWSPKSWVKWLAGKPYPGDKKFKPEGYRIQDVGPKSMEGKGMDDFSRTREKLLAQGRGGCPFAFARS
ncbi:hypothetical protein K490DRAFT_72476 [Saccharata proteae CBS 121410]|uniref:ER-bound oxygenase mpaB/mpaB'/Rubber oxygenase catalytic domain-containing protein n=1 Tax=Saccharata proteae CBS 121410 TaxID=1314787 RepID=A0A6A5YA71_9PEZI|nr:hypothetical protein K490DRAFT_72476 [Saccharata proteae CBS 121410]